MNRAPRAVSDVSTLPDYTFGATAVGWWGVVGFMLIEGAGFVLAIGTYYYLIPNERLWPPAASPGLLWGTAFLIVALASDILNVWIKRSAERQDRTNVRIGLVAMVLTGLLLIGLRALEFTALNVRWDENAYGSIVWAIVSLHTLHLVTDVYDSVVAAALVHTKKVTGRRFSEVDDNCLYWHFIVWSWVALYFVIYWTPRWLSIP